jgi:hypothetical protein
MPERSTDDLLLQHARLCLRRAREAGPGLPADLLRLVARWRCGGLDGPSIAHMVCTTLMDERAPAAEAREMFRAVLKKTPVILVDYVP